MKPTCHSQVFYYIFIIESKAYYECEYNIEDYDNMVEKLKYYHINEIKEI